MSVSPEEPYTFPDVQTPPPSTEEEPIPNAHLSAEEEAALCAHYEEKKRLLENAETQWGSDWPEGPLSFGGCGW